MFKNRLFDSRIDKSFLSHPYILQRMLALIKSNQLVVSWMEFLCFLEVLLQIS